MDAKTITISTELFYTLCEADMAMKILKKHQKKIFRDERLAVLDAVLAAYGTEETEEKEEEEC